MKKAILISFVILLLLTVGMYIFIPAEINISKYALANSNHNGVYRCLTNKNSVKDWWPGNSLDKQNKKYELNEESAFYFNGSGYLIGQGAINGISIQIQRNHSIIPST